MTPAVEAGQPEHVLGHPLAPLTTGVRAGECLTQAVGGAGQRGGDLGVDVERTVHLAEALRRGLAELADEEREPLQVGLHALLHLAEAVIDELMAPGERRVGGAWPGHRAARGPW